MMANESLTQKLEGYKKDKKLLCVLLKNSMKLYGTVKEVQDSCFVLENDKNIQKEIIVDVNSFSTIISEPKNVIKKIAAEEGISETIRKSAEKIQSD